MIWQGFEEKDSLCVAQFVSRSPTSVEVQGPVVLLAFQGHAEGVWPFLCRHLVDLSRTLARGWDFSWLVLVFVG